jgi:hypothetical protein
LAEQGVIIGNIEMQQQVSQFVEKQRRLPEVGCCGRWVERPLPN